MKPVPPRRRASALATVAIALAALVPLLQVPAAQAASGSTGTVSTGMASTTKAPPAQRARPALSRRDGGRVTLRSRQAPLPRRGADGRPLARAADGSLSSSVTPPSTSSSVTAAAAAPASSITVVYASAFPADAKVAFERAVTVWEGLVASPVEIRVRADWFTPPPPAPGEGEVLGSAGPTAVYRGTGLGNGQSFYPSALADALVGQDIGADPAFGDATDIDAAFSSRAQFHFGTGLPPAGTIDFSTVVLHELGHGLGFTGSALVDAGFGSTDPVGVIFDTFAASSLGARLLDVPAGAATAGVLQSYVGWTGPAGRAAYSGESPPLYAPAVFEPGSSYAHLDESTFPIGDPNSLMTPYLSPSEQILDPGAVALGILQDLGWKIGASRPVAVRPSFGFTPLTPARILDTRVSRGGAGPLGGGRSRTLQVSGLGGVPSSARAVVLNVTAVNPGNSFVTVYPAADGRPTASNLNTRVGETIANLVTVKLDAAGRVAFYNDVGSTDLLADVAGYYSNAAATVGFQAVDPTRLLDTRTLGQAVVGPKDQRTVPVRGVPGLPADVSAVVVNVTAVRPSSATFITAYPSGAAQPNVSTLNPRPGVTTPNLATVAVGADGAIKVFNDAGSTHLVVDLAGFYAGSAAGRFVPLPPRRVVDTRASAFPAGTAVVASAPKVTNFNALGLPAAATAVVANITAVAPTAGSFITVHPMPTRPNVSNLNTRAGVTVPNLVAVKLGAGTAASAGRIGLYNEVGSVNLLADLAGYFR